LKTKLSQGSRYSRLSYDERHAIYGASRLSLCQKDDGQLCREYILRDRGIDWGTIAKFRLGFVPFHIDHLFSGKMVMPIFNSYGRLLALSVRPIYKVISKTDGKNQWAMGLKVYKDQYVFKNYLGKECRLSPSEVVEVKDPKPKYWNEQFPKSEHLFGLNLAKYSIAKWGFAILVEGQMDVIALHSRGITNAVGVMGGAFTPMHALLLKKWTDQVVVLMDSDKAGTKHANFAAKTMEVYKGFGLKGSRLTRPGGDRLGAFSMKIAQGTDPDTFVRRHGGMAMRQRIADAVMSSNFILPDSWLVRGAA
jgi:DNA primase